MHKWIKNRRRWTRLRPTQLFQDIPLLVRWVLNNGLLSIDDMLLQLMRQHTFETKRQACSHWWEQPPQTETLIGLFVQSLFQIWRHALRKTCRRERPVRVRNASWQALMGDTHLQLVSTWTTGQSCSRLLWLEYSDMEERWICFKLYIIYLKILKYLNVPNIPYNRPYNSESQQLLFTGKQWLGFQFSLISHFSD